MLRKNGQNEASVSMDEMGKEPVSDQTVNLEKQSLDETFVPSQGRIDSSAVQDDVSAENIISSDEQTVQSNQDGQSVSSPRMYGQPVDAGADNQGFVTTSSQASETKSKRRMYGQTTEAGIHYREQLEKERAEEEEFDKVRGKKIMIVFMVLTILVLIGMIVMIVLQVRSLQSGAQKLTEVQSQLEYVRENPEYVERQREADVINTGEYAKQICDLQNQLSKITYEESCTGSAMSEKHQQLLDEYRQIAKRTKLTSVSSSTWLSDILHIVAEKEDHPAVMPYTWVCDSDFDRMGTVATVAWTCYYHYGKPDQEMYEVVICSYDMQTECITTAAVYTSDAYKQIIESK